VSHDLPAGRLRVGYIGCGNMAQRVHLPNLASIPDCELVALAEIRSSLGKKVQARYGIPNLYADHRALLEDHDVEAVAVSGQFALQGEIARDCLLAGKDVFMEKPMAVSVAQAERLLDAVRSTGKRLMVGYMKRYDPGNQYVRATTSSWRTTGEAGRVVLARAHGFCGDWTAGIDMPALETTVEPIPAVDVDHLLPEWLPSQWRKAYVGFLQQYTHNVNLLRFVLDAGDDARVVHADLDPDGYTGLITLRIDGVRSVLETGRLRYHRWDEHTQVYFEEGWLHTWAPPLLLRNAVAEVEVYRSGKSGSPGEATTHTYTRPLPEPRWSWAYKREAEHFVRCVRGGEPFASSAEDTLTDVRLFEDIFRTWLQL
jgi:predicted dehydrogenase